MKKAIIPILCAVMLLGGCSNSAETMNGTAEQENVPYEQLSGEGTGWGFVRKKGAAPEIPNAQKEVLSRYDCYYIDENSPKTLYLTFDEGYENGYTSKILDVLEQTGTPAAFFVTGPYLENQTELVQRMIDNGHILGNHTVNHLNLPEQSVETVQSELSELNKTCEEMYGVTMKYMRPPEGEYSERVLSVAKDMGYKTILWSFAYKDWDINMQQGADYAFSQVTPYLHDGAILLLHAVSSDNANALEDIINYAKNEGYVFKSLDDIK
ncbi:MAG: polysaccharide deacetylase family protein [Oscillospiraceae bacterium]|nr:polysaccharide deacetylase family protein [Oscillospiraceae bacterium]